MSIPSHPFPVASHPDTHHRMLAILALVSLALAWFWMSQISARDPWYRNSDMNIHNIADALSLNSGYEPGIVDQPAATTKFLLAFDFRVRNEVGLLPVWTVKRFARSSEPLRDFSRFVHAGRVHSRLLVIVFILLSGVFVRSVTGKFDTACLAVVLLCGSSGLLFHGLLLRPELLCAAFGGVLTMQFAWLATTTPRANRRALWLAAAGVCGGLSLLSKMPAVFYIALAYAWCWVTPWLGHPGEEPEPAKRSGRVWASALCLAAGVATLLLLAWAGTQRAWVDDATLARLRALATVTALVPLAALLPGDRPLRRYLFDRATDGALLLAGLLLSFVAWFGLLRLILPTDAAIGYMGRILNTVIHPEPLLALFTHVSGTHRTQEALKFVLETPVLIVSTTALAVFVATLRTTPLRLRALVLLLLIQGLGMILTMSKRQFLEQYSVFVQVPLLLIWPLSAAALQAWWRQRYRQPEPRWPFAVGATTALFLGLTMPLALIPKYSGFQNDAERPVRDFTITFFYDHDVHPQPYREAMKKHFPTRQQFAETLNRYLEEPAQRY